MHITAQKLTNLASRQAGLFTVHQAVQCGIDRSNTSKYVKSGVWEKVGTGSLGIYKLVGLEVDNEYESKWLAFLWSFGRDGRPKAVISHESAFEIWEISDVQSPEIHLTVRRGFRRHTNPPVKTKIHFLDYDDKDVQQLDSGLLVMKPLPTIRELLREERISSEYIEQGFADAMAKGEITLPEMHRLEGFSNEERKKISGWIKQTDRNFAK